MSAGRFPARSNRDRGVSIEDQEIAPQGLFTVDADGMLCYQVVDEVIRVIEALQPGELCPVDWQEGAATLGKA